MHAGCVRGEGGALRARHLSHNLGEAVVAQGGAQLGHAGEHPDGTAVPQLARGHGAALAQLSVLQQFAVQWERGRQLGWPGGGWQASGGGGALRATLSVRTSLGGCLPWRSMGKAGRVMPSSLLLAAAAIVVLRRRRDGTARANVRQQTGVAQANVTRAARPSPPRFPLERAPGGVGGGLARRLVRHGQKRAGGSAQVSTDEGCARQHGGGWPKPGRA